MYDSPIKMLVEDTIGKLDESVWKAVINVGFDIDKEELRKALEYDRDQYRKGYEDGKLAAIVHAHWIGLFYGYADGGKVFDSFECSHCKYKIYDEYYNLDKLPKFCPECGAMMDEEVTSEEE